MNFAGEQAINGKLGVATMVVDGNIEELFYCKKIEAKVTKNKGTVNTIGSLMTSHKTGSLEGTGTLEMYYYSPLFKKMMKEYKNTGRDIYFTLQIENTDEASDSPLIGAATTLYGCNLDEAVVALLDSETESLTESIAFTFEDFD